MDQYPRPSSPLSTPARIVASTPLADATIYRPGPYLALGLLAIPVLIALAGAFLALNTHGSVPVWLPLLLLLWIPCLPLALLTLKAVRTSNTGIAVGRPWKLWDEVPWQMVERVEKHGPRVIIIGTDGTRITFVPRLMRDGLRLHRQLLLRLPPHVLGGGLRQEAQSIVMGDLYAMAEGGLTGTLRARPRPYHVAGAVLVLVIALAVGVAAVLRLPLWASIPLGLLALVLAAGAGLTIWWLLQEVQVTEKGLRVQQLLGGRSASIAWEDVQLIECDPREVMLRLRGDHRLRCIGPNLLRPTQRDMMRAFIHEYCRSRGVPVVRRVWMW